VKAAIVIALLLLAVTPLAGQDTGAPTLAPGARVRVIVDRPTQRRHTGDVAEVTPDMIVLTVLGPNFGTPTRLVIPRTDIAAVSVSAGSPRRTYALRGAISGGIFGLLLGYLNRGIGTAYGDVAVAPPARHVVPLAGAAGAGLGALIGAIVAREQWVSVGVP
jgi:hypothetical protein